MVERYAGNPTVHVALEHSSESLGPVADMTLSASMNAAPSPHVQRAAADCLRRLLLEPGPYLELWSRYVDRGPDGVINQLAVTEVLAGHLRAVPRRPGDVRIAPYQLRETVSQALAGRQLSRQALQLFIGAFRIGDEDAGQLWKLWEGVQSLRAVTGRAAVSPRAEQIIAATLGPRGHQTLSMNEHVWVGADGRVDQYHITQVIEAVEDGVDRIPFICDSKSVALEVGQGCRGVYSELSDMGENLTSTEILLSRRLNRGETSSIEYWVACGDEDGPDDTLECECRRAVLKRLENYEQRIEFHPNKLPSMVRWAQWDGVGGDVIVSESTQMDSQHSVQRYLQSIERSVVGFYWMWPES
jgi:hypothetical protein